eukprot:9156552-Alexandrium_andersonii.AAC.1
MAFDMCNMPPCRMAACTSTMSLFCHLVHMQFLNPPLAALLYILPSFHSRQHQQLIHTSAELCQH